MSFVEIVETELKKKDYQKQTSVCISVGMTYSNGSVACRATDDVIKDKIEKSQYFSSY